ncbi:type II toxin-antitoxin system death-on-curing family toxin [Synechococcus sp. CBW1006]|uniref:type II toxin-antitoxin system death-on-curing family toxin n=1 Tax=Synechococcus sp. CBW1006 TaxID=1353138 RepID=UPI0018CF9F14|nr:type II toxin-antitoxin system death-on-curing family toxin [Synechococcus sp. CBW1006]QPN65945.1 type II toxin-antitoxin system death-on-curing family toxin [Synechococcus sp. CBW1006]
MTLPAEPRWVPDLAVRAIHHQQRLEHGGLSGLRDAALLDAAMARPRQRWSYGELGTIVPLAAAYAEALIRAHPFVDGNKRTGFLVSLVFLGLNGFRFEASNQAVVLTIQRLAAGSIPWAELEAWYQACSHAPTPGPAS